MENDVHNFVTKLIPTPNIRVRGVGNQLMEAKGKGTVLRKIEDDNGVVHEKLFPGTLYIPELKLCLLSPQSWCQSADDNFPRRDGTWQYQTADKFVIEWDQQKIRRTVPWDRRTNEVGVWNEALPGVRFRSRPETGVSQTRAYGLSTCHPGRSNGSGQRTR
jgi:hypothetical protein